MPRHFIYLVSFLLSFQISSAQSDGLILISNKDIDQNYFTSLITNNYSINHTWFHPAPVHSTAYIQKDSTLIVPLVINDPIMPIPNHAGGRFQKLNWDGDVIWEFNFYDTLYTPHHDIDPLPNGNILVICWEVKTKEDAESLGRLSIEDQIWPTMIVELEPPNGIIVWEWHLWDHLVQDVDSSLPNYGVISEHPELLDINIGGPVSNSNGDWLHMNAIQYNEELDQIIFSSRHLNEIFIIDHSTTTEEAAGHSGGNSGKGGDFLFRWGNPINYERGDIDDRKLVAPHGVNWVQQNFPGSGNIIIFNNNPNDDNTEGNSEVIEIIPPINDNGHYYISSESAYGPDEIQWSHGGDNTYFSGWQSGAYRLHNGNTLVTVSQQKYIFEVDNNNEIVWQCHTGGNLGWIDYPLRVFKLEPSYFLDSPITSSSSSSIFKINQNYPNPFNISTNINYELLKDSFITVRVYNIQGEIMTTLIDEWQTAGVYSTKWEGKNQNGKHFSSGIYFYKIQTDRSFEIKKLTLLK